MASSAGEPRGVSFEEGTVGSNNGKPKSQQFQPSRTKKVLPNIPIQTSAAALANGPNVDQNVASSVAQYMANTNTPQEAIDTIESDPSLSDAKKGRLVDYIKRKYNTADRNRITGQIKASVSTNLERNTEADELAKTAIDAAETLEEAEAMLKADPGTDKAVVKRALEMVRRDFPAENTNTKDIDALIQELNYTGEGLKSLSKRLVEEYKQDPNLRKSREEWALTGLHQKVAGLRRTFDAISAKLGKNPALADKVAEAKTLLADVNDIYTKYESTLKEGTANAISKFASELSIPVESAGTNVDKAAERKAKQQQTLEQRRKNVLNARKAKAAGLTPAIPPPAPIVPPAPKKARSEKQQASNKRLGELARERARKLRLEKEAAAGSAQEAVGAAVVGTATGAEGTEGDENTADAGATNAGLEENNSALLNAKQPTLLRIGGDAASEYVELKGGAFKSLGGFEVVTMGLGTKEFKKLYNIRTAEQFSVMQQVFGVARLGGKPRLWAYLESACEFDGLATVVAALKFRSKTLQAAIELNANSTTSKRYKHFKSWVDATLAKLATAKGSCPAVPTTTVNVAVGPNVSGGPKNLGGAACPCLTDINLLRDLVYVMALARGNASPEIRKQIEAIPINSILEAAAGNNSSKLYPGMKATLIEIIKILRSASTAVKNGDVPEIPQDVLKTIYKALAPPGQTIPEAVELDDILSVIDLIKQELMKYQEQAPETKEADCEEQDAELVYLRALKDDLEEKLRTAGDISGGLDELVRRLQGQIETMTGQIRDCEGEKAEKDTRIAALEAELARMAEQKAADETAAGEAHAAALAEKQQEIDALSVAADLLGDQKKRLEVERDAAKAAAAEVESLRERLAACETEKEGLAGELATAKARVSELEDELAELARSTMSSKNKSTQARTALEEQLKKWKETVAELTTKDTEQQAQIAALAQQVKGQLSELEQLRLRVAELSKEKDRANREKGRANAAEAASTGKNAEIAGLKTNLGNAKAALAEREAMAAVAAAELAAARAALEEQKQQGNTNAASAKAGFETQLAQEKAKLADCEAAAEAAKKKHETDLAELNAKLTESQKVLDELQELADKTKGEKAATQQQLDNALAKIKELEAQITSATSTGAEQQSSFEAERAGFRARIKELEAQLEADRQMAAGTEAELQKEAAALKVRISELETQHAKEVQALKDEQATKNRAAKTAQNAKVAETEAAKQAEIDTKEAEIRQLKEELAAKQAQLGIITEKNAAIAAKNALIAQQKGQIEDGNKALAEVLAKQGTLTATITELEGKLGALEGEKTAATNQRSKNASEIQSLKAQLASALNQKRTNDTQLQKLQANLGAAPKQTNVDALTAQLSQAKDQLSQITAKLAEVEAVKGSEIATTSAALQNALAELAVSKEQQDALAKAAKGDMSGLQDIKKETCDFFFFLYDTINLQLRNIQKMNIPDALRADIFKMYNLADSYATINKQELLNELSLVFQEFFYKFNTLTGAGGKGLPLQSSYPLLSEIVKNTRLTDDKGACSLTPKEQFQIREQLQIIGYQYQFGIEPNAEGDTLSIIPKPASSDLCRDTKHEHDHYVPLTVLAIRMIQLLHETFEGRYKELKARCLPSNVAAAVEVRPAEETA